MYMTHNRGTTNPCCLRVRRCKLKDLWAGDLHPASSLLIASVFSSVWRPVLARIMSRPNPVYQGL